MVILAEFRSVTSERRRAKNRKERTEAKYNGFPCKRTGGHKCVRNSFIHSFILFVSDHEGPWKHKINTQEQEHTHKR